MILVTGGTGYIGSHTVVELLDEGMEVVIVDNLSNSERDVIDGIRDITGKQPFFEEIDLRDRRSTYAVFEKYPSIAKRLKKRDILIKWKFPNRRLLSIIIRGTNSSMKEISDQAAFESRALM